MDVNEFLKSMLSGEMEVFNKEVKKNNGISGVVYLPKKYIGHKVAIVSEQIKDEN